MAHTWYVLTSPDGHEVVKSDADRGGVARYATEHRCTVDELTRHRVLKADLMPWPADPLLLWRWSPSRAAKAAKAHAA